VSRSRRTSGRRRASSVRRLERAAKEALDAAVARRQGRGVPLTAMMRMGDARDEILAVATEIGADVVVIGTQGRKGSNACFSAASPSGSCAPPTARSLSSLRHPRKRRNGGVRCVACSPCGPTSRVGLRRPFFSSVARRWTNDPRDPSLQGPDEGPHDLRRYDARCRWTGRSHGGPRDAARALAELATERYLEPALRCRASSMR